MRIFFVCPDPVWNDLGWVFRRAGHDAPGWAHGSSWREIEFRLAMYHQAEKPVDLIVADENMLRDGTGALLAENFSGIPVLKFTFDHSAIRSTGWEWYAQQVEVFLARMRAKGAA